MAIEPRRSGGVRPLHAFGVAVVAIGAVLIAFWALAFLASIGAIVIKLAIVVAIIAGLVALVRRIV
jgi:hypothetical protein